MEHIRNQQQQAHLPPPHILLQQQQQLHQMKLLQAQQMQAQMAAAAAAGMADPRFMRPRHPSSGGAGGPLFGPPVGAGAGSRGPSPTTILSSGLMGGMPPMPPMPPHMPPAGHGMPGTPSGATGGLSRFFRYVLRLTGSSHTFVMISFFKKIIFLCSPEVLAQANAGNAPHMPPLPTQKVLTLEEIERQAAAVRI